MKVTLKNLHKATAQQVFDQVATHLLLQGVKSTSTDHDLNSFRCSYRGDGATMCAAGCLIADDEYLQLFEDCGWRYLVENEYVPVAHVELIVALQCVHDRNEPHNWRQILIELAEREVLNKAALA